MVSSVSTACSAVLSAHALSLPTTPGARRKRAMRAERLQVIGAGSLGRQQQKDQVHRLLVGRLEIDRLGQAREETEDPRRGREACRAGWRCRRRRRSSRASRARPASRKSRARSRPVIAAAFSASAWRTCFLLLALSAGRTASGPTRSPRSILAVRTGLHGRRAARSAPRRRRFSRYRIHYPAGVGSPSSRRRWWCSFSRRL